MKNIRTELDDEFEDAVAKFISHMRILNNKAVYRGEDDIKYASCFIIECLSNMIEE
jgi:hypothetical protein